MSQIEAKLNNDSVRTDDKSMQIIGHIILFLTFGVLLIWAYFAPINGGAIAPGVVGVKHNSKTVQHLGGGIVKKIFVKEGMKVDIGDVLVELDDVQTKAFKEQLISEAIGLKIQQETNKLSESSYSEELAELKGLLAEGFADKNQLRALEREHRRILAIVAETNSKLSGVEEKLTVAEDALERLLVRAPVKGTVFSLMVHTEGGVIQGGSDILSIVPDGQALTIKSRVTPEDIDRVHVGLEAEIRFSLFKSAINTPELFGKVINLSADRLTNEQTGIGYYEVELEINPESIQDMAGLELVPGMPAEVMILTGERTLLQYLGKPVSDAFARSFLEE
tara:strand:- start:1632 stop:2636 length:1005 start_codon:yes stop_codon:yes gene_type:complete